MLTLFFYMNISDHSIYIIQNVFIIIFLIVCFSWSLSNKDNIFQKLSALPLIKNNVLYFGLWHSWNMFINPARTNSVLYLSIDFLDGTVKLVDLYNPNTNLFINRKLNIHDVKYIENFISDASIRTYFSEFLFKLYSKQYQNKIQKITVIHNFKVIPDFFTQQGTMEKAKVLAEWPQA